MRSRWKERSWFPILIYCDRRYFYLRFFSLSSTQQTAMHLMSKHDKFIFSQFPHNDGHSHLCFLLRFPKGQVKMLACSLVSQILEQEGICFRLTQWSMETLKVSNETLMSYNVISGVTFRYGMLIYYLESVHRFCSLRGKDQRYELKEGHPLLVSQFLDLVSCGRNRAVRIHETQDLFLTLTPKSIWDL